MYTMEQRIADYAKELQDHVLTLVQAGPVTAWKMAKPGTGINRVLLVFSPEGIVLQGDLTPERNGSVSTFGYGLEWFTRQLGWSYLAEKFLTKRWVPELAEEQLREWIDEYPEHSAELQKIADALVDFDHRELSDRLYEIEPGFVDDHLPGWGYDPNEAALLQAIQRRFAELYALHKASISALAGGNSLTSAPSLT